VSGEVGIHISNPNHAAFRDAFVKVSVSLLKLPPQSGDGSVAAV
jgi:hypothetical protein